MGGVERVKGSAAFLQTPFNFGAHALETECESYEQELPRTKEALLDFHASENPIRHKM